eukprot:scaffold668724_cov59-Prasinocladus_malaysianus.AAC.1
MNRAYCRQVSISGASSNTRPISTRQPRQHTKLIVPKAHVPATFTMPSADRQAVVERLLSDDQYHIEFNGYLTNHAKHAIVALHGLDATPKRVQEYWDEYTAVTPYGLKLEPAESTPEVSTAYCDHF